MHTLFINTASNPNFLALCTEEATLSICDLPTHGNEEIMPKIEEILDLNNLEYKDLDQIACAIGPGGFTSLRTGIAVANTLSYSLKIPAAGIHLSDLCTSRIKDFDKPFLWLHSTRRAELFVKGFGENGTSTPVALMDIRDVSGLQGEYIGELIQEHKDILVNCTQMDSGKLSNIKDVLPGTLSSLKYSKAILMPWYGREA
ncbi:tRNA (adenosine(37)-N6)-threonylcarbamoyltransferase complex dimerization subunit type 1 TsaB [Candidatus Peribacteria bacterium]|jgi:tRNA threonylcarbamoyl adenosine modification protein YeaZ|nr:tRNA (adenosine(37)-N6)-threonylcarbamoyltransferase complex dimerization subunit type 1 TsaB [Candidatus Peribacteria bacterium]MBT4021012.1 tRNA (adenosine(37)-N6)-threonylcarbamoyltransferase complex dimerization subunit type 1 TsaB [Candidatus Peribacteria bacterium]MBT4240911.1 tRNA (adenosine(37)-N6)-threonylcarbamoyltransferase complex dimerization subunit type 1 TsaB [Candidatus Peribacteria bacterium]MBT4474554.1 tRNA (adenosine(37)-N6)-threonylcarbamoyltransferase complex dimerizati